MKRYIHRRNIRFKNEIAKADKRKIIGVAIDPSSNFHRAIIFNFLGEIKVEPFSIDILKTGFESLLKIVEKVKKSSKALDVYFGVESAGVYSENLINHLNTRFKNVCIISSYSVANNRKQKFLVGLKTDDIDCGAIGDLLIRGEFTKFVPDSFLYYKLKNLVYWREKKIRLRILLKNQITNRMLRCFPGINCNFDDQRPLASSVDKTLLSKGLLSHAMTGQEILKLSDEDLLNKFNYPEKYNAKHAQIKKFKNRLNNMLLVEEEFAKVHLDILSVDGKYLRSIDLEIDNIEKQIIELGQRTPAVHLIGQIKGINELYASMYIGLIGDVNKYSRASKIFSYSGLSPKIRQSGKISLSHSVGISRAGNVLLRSLLFNMAKAVLVNDLYFSSYYKMIKTKTKRHWKMNFIAVANKLNKVLFALIRDKSKFKGGIAGNSS